MVTLDSVEWKNGDNPWQTTNFTNGSAGILNSAVNNAIKIKGTYTPSGTGKIWVIKIKIASAGPDNIIDAALDGSGNYTATVASGMLANTQYTISVHTATMKDGDDPIQNATKPDPVTLLIGSQDP